MCTFFLAEFYCIAPRAFISPAIRPTKKTRCCAWFQQPAKKHLWRILMQRAREPGRLHCECTAKTRPSFSTRSDPNSEESFMNVRLIENLATTREYAEVFSDASLLRAMLDFEAALARAEASSG